jgi:hypothetical protein
MVRDYLAEVIKVHARLEPNTTVETEVTIQGTGPRGAKKADILVRRGAASVMIDVGIVEPAAPSYRAEGSHLREEVAADIMAARKQREFDDAAITDVSFVPFIVEATGRLGKTAMDFLQDGFGEQYVEYHVNTFVRRLSAAIAKMNGVCISMARKLRIYRHVTELA